jgi:hypothetical protein
MLATKVQMTCVGLDIDLPVLADTKTIDGGTKDYRQLQIRVPNTLDLVVIAFPETIAPQGDRIFGNIFGRIRKKILAHPESPW